MICGNAEPSCLETVNDCLGYLAQVQMKKLESLSIIGGRLRFFTSPGDERPILKAPALLGLNEVHFMTIPDGSRSAACFGDVQQLHITDCAYTGRFLKLISAGDWQPIHLMQLYRTPWTMDKTSRRSTRKGSKQERSMKANWTSSVPGLWVKTFPFGSAITGGSSMTDLAGGSRTMELSNPNTFSITMTDHVSVLFRRHLCAMLRQPVPGRLGCVSQRRCAEAVPAASSSSRRVEASFPYEPVNQVDASGSTAGSIIKHEHEFVKPLHCLGRDRVLTWGTVSNDPVFDLENVQWSGNMGGTSPSTILSNPNALSALNKSDVWYLLTDGEIWDADVPALFRLANETGAINVPIVFVVAGNCRSSPASMNISVGISFLANASDVLFLFKDCASGSLFIFAAKGCFSGLVDSPLGDTPELSSWSRMKRLTSEQQFLDLCATELIQVPVAETRPMQTVGLVDLGQTWRKKNEDTLVDLNILFDARTVLGQVEAMDLLAEEAFGNLSLACKTRGRTQHLRHLLLAQKVEQVSVRLEDNANAAAIVSRLGDAGLDQDARNQLQQQLREAHKLNRACYQTALRDATTSTEAQTARVLNRLVNDALQQLTDLEKTTYTADILSRRSNRARRAETVAAGGEIQVTSLNLETPKAFRGECWICCGDNEVMSVVLKSGADGAANTDNFALDFPLAAGRFESNLDLISSQHICFQCAIALNGRTIHQETIAAIIPTVEYTSSNKKYIQEQLYFGLTGGLRTGASGVSQLFMAVLDGVLSEKQWAGAQGQSMEDLEISRRRAMLQWTLDSMLLNTGCRETFSELGPWVTFPEALSWAVRDFQANGVDSWAIGYPLAGFTQLVSLGIRAGAFDDKVVAQMRVAKMLHGLVSNYLALTFKHGNEHDQSWKQPVMAMIYASFNASLVPTDKRGGASLVNEPVEFCTRLRAFFASDVDLLDRCSESEKLHLMRRAQLLSFWLLYHLPSHAKTKTFFAYMRQSEALATTVLDVSFPALPDAAVIPTLTSIFRASDPADHAFFARHTSACQFASPFGASVLRCGFPACGEWFIQPEDLPDVDREWTAKELDRLRQARAAHLVKAFAVDDTFGKLAQTGMPLPLDGKAPTSIHVNLHVSVARVWSQLNKVTRQHILSGEVGHFVALVERKVYETGRGDVYQENLAHEIRVILPSFFKVLHDAAARKGAGRRAEDFEHDWRLNRLEVKAKWEMRAMEEAEWEAYLVILGGHE
ncbi:hypothetical protein BDZ85DRAFT_300517 [Elsinoe ampelina]|uniref:Uncharacterized protein n=1 Tax=Elsinoe ampelina TaxID=302913 RepID=A0A6A6GPS3_9PEZI|nr:hypothetical protein BDZ85DRAFT_300517 [Elsinoe ampelina]